MPMRARRRTCGEARRGHAPTVAQHPSDAARPHRTCCACAHARAREHTHAPLGHSANTRSRTFCTSTDSWKGKGPMSPCVLRNRMLNVAMAPLFRLPLLLNI